MPAIRCVNKAATSKPQRKPAMILGSVSKFMILLAIMCESLRKAKGRSKKNTTNFTVNSRLIAAFLPPCEAG